MHLWLRICLSLLLPGVYVLACIAFIGVGGYLYVVGLIWLALALATTCIWHQRWLYALSVILAGACAAAVWSFIFVDFPPKPWKGLRCQCNGY